MKRSERFVSIILLLTLVILIALVSVLGCFIYNEFAGEGSIEITVGEAGYPVIEYKKSQKEETKKPIDSSIFEGVGDENTTTETPPTTSKYKHLYNQLDSNAKIIYNKLYQNKENLKTGTYTIEFGNTFDKLLSKEGGSDELQKQYQSAIEVLIYENPDIFYLEATNMYINIEVITRITGTSYNVYINSGNNANYLADGFYSKQDVDRCQQQIEEKRDQILSAVYGKSDFDKIKFIHDYLVENIEYDSTISENNIYNIYGALIAKRCVCEGYAKAFQYLLNEVGIDNVIVIGTGTNRKNETENHAWNYVKLNNNWYAVDSTWDDPIVIGGTLTNSAKYKYFLKGSETMGRNHTASGKFTEKGQEFSYPTLSALDY